MPVSARPVIELRDVAVGYGDRVVVSGVDLRITDGEVVAVLGANGSGKTTLIRGILGLADVLHGQVELHGRPVRSRRDRARIGYVPQRHTVGGAVPSTVREVVSSGRLPRMGLLARMGPADRAVVRASIEAVDLTAVADVDIAQLSGGQQRRALIARALAAEPDLLVMDEPTAGVDQASQQALAQTIRRLAARAVPMVVVTHEVGPLADVVTRAIVLSGGRVTYDGGQHGDGDHHHLPDQFGRDPDGLASAWLDHPFGGR